MPDQNKLDAILKYKMDDLEAKAYKVALIWERLARQEFPKVQVSKLKKTGDPRKSHLFRHCYKLCRETTGLLKDNEYKLYVLAQLQIMKTLQENVNAGVMIDCQILAGDRSWRRWKVWKKHYDKKYNKPQSSDELDIKADIKTVVADLERTKTYLLKMFKKYPTVKDFEPLISDLTVLRWVSLGKVSPYYAMLSPRLQEALGGTFEARYAFDLSAYKQNVSDEVREEFKKMFSEEYQ